MAYLGRRDFDGQTLPISSLIEDLNSTYLIELYTNALAPMLGPLFLYTMSELNFETIRYKLPRFFMTICRMSAENSTHEYNSIGANNKNKQHILFVFVARPG